MKTFLTGLLSLIVLILASGCQEEEIVNPARCPSIRDNITWKSTGAYGDFKLGQEGRDSAARELASACGWHIVPGHNGGYGNTLDIASEHDEVIFTWAENTFAWFRVSKGWQGRTDRGIRLGATVNEFLAVYPEFQLYYKTESLVIYDYTEMINGSYKSVEAYFRHDVLDQITVY